MTYQIIPLALDVLLDLDRIQRTLVRYTDGKFYAEIYKHGTCVFPVVLPNEGVQDGRSLLGELARRPLDFTVREMDDRNYVVRYGDAVFSIVFEDEFALQRNEISLQAREVLTDEAIVKKLNAPQDHLLIGLYARTRLIEDIQDLEPIRLISPDAPKF
jgi:hypothetical protein